MEAAIKALKRELRAIAQTLDHMRNTSREAHSDFYKHPDLPAVLIKKNEIECALKSLALAPRVTVDGNVLLYRYKLDSTTKKTA